MNQILKFSLLIALCFAAFALQAQILPPPPPGGAPVDGGAGFLVAAGLAYGAKKLRDARRRKQQDEGENTP